MLHPVPAAELAIKELVADVVDIVISGIIDVEADIEVTGVVTVTREGKKDVRYVGTRTAPERARQVTETSGCTRMSC